MKIPFFHIDAFTGTLFQGNPAGVCLLDNWPADSLMQHIAAENNLPETAFLVPAGDQYLIRWFSPLVEIDLCGHATLAAGHVILNDAAPHLAAVSFHSPRSGPLTVERHNGLLRLNFPAQPPIPCAAPDNLLLALQIKPTEVLQSEDYLAVFDSPETIEGLSPDLELLKTLDLRGVIVTAPGKGVDFVSRFFAPKVGIDEDPVTGSAHCALIPYWKKRLNKERLHALQISARGGELFCQDCGDRVLISGKAVCYLRGSISC